MNRSRCLGEGVGALHLDRVLGRDHQERPGELVGGPVDGRLVLLHALQEGGLGLGGGSVDLVGDHDVGEDRARPELELVLLLAVDRHAGDVAGQQVRGELDAPDGAVDRAGERFRQRRLAHAGDVLEQQVSLCEQHGHGEAYQLAAAGDHGLHRGAHRRGGLGEVVELRRGGECVDHVDPFVVGWHRS